MEVRLGWSGDIHGSWTKMDVAVEESDLALHFYDLGAVTIAQLSMTPVEKFKLMYVLAEIFVQFHKMSRFPEYFAKEEDKKDLADLIATRDKLSQEILRRAHVAGA